MNAGRAPSCGLRTEGGAPHGSVLEPPCRTRAAPDASRTRPKAVGQPLRIGHRGAAGYRPENTVSSILNALERGVDLVEVDVRRSRDGHLVLLHDAGVDRTTDGSGLVAEMSLRELRRLDAGGGERIPTLEEALAAACGRAGLLLEVKAEALGEQVYWTVATADFPGPVVYASFLHGEVLAIRRMDRQALGMALLEGVPVQPTAFAREARATHVGLSLASATPGFVRALHADGFQVVVYTVNEPDEIDRTKSLGVDGIISDFPDRL
ncbi:MAG: glycerophosphodiester phosphodiesterase [Deltaproteobacteria bacterium]|nr:glycerophosphodiester phosphodiesterase [Deltaproteobacteria bacterium]